MLQDIEYVYDDTYKIIDPEDGDYLIIVRNDYIMLGGDQALPKYGHDFYGHKCYYLFRIASHKYFFLDGEPEEFGEYHYTFFHQMMRALPKWQDFGIVTGKQFANWYKSNRYCGRCGKPNRLSDKERMFYCPDCKTMIFPKISPAVIVAVIDRERDRICVTRRSPKFKGYALVSGYSEVGESIEKTCEREVFEEVGIKIKNLRFYKSQPWSYSDSLLMGFVADLDGDPELTVDHNENYDAFWVDRKDMQNSKDDYTLTRELLDEFARGNI